MNIKERLQQQLGKEISQSSNSEIYNGLLNITQQLADEKAVSYTHLDVYKRQVQGVKKLFQKNTEKAVA